MRTITTLIVACLVALGALPARAEVHALSFPTGGVTIPAALHVPEGGGADTVVVFLHGNPGRPLGPRAWMVEPLVERGAAVFRFNYRGLWGNEGDYNLTHALADLDAALDFLTRPDALAGYGVTPERIVLFGYSFGTSVALVGAANDDRVDAIASLAPCDHGYFGAEMADPDSPLQGFFESVGAQLFGEGGVIPQDASVFTDDLVEHADAFRLPPKAPALRDARLLFVVGLDDTICPVEDHFFPLYRALRSASHPAVEVSVLAMDHGAHGVGLPAIAGEVAEWVAASGRNDLASTVGSDAWLERFAASYTAAWNAGDPEAVAEHYAPDGVLAVPGAAPAVGRAEIAEVVRGFMTAFPDLELTFDGFRFVDGRIRYRWTFRGTNTGPEGTGAPVEFSGDENWRLTDDGTIESSIGRFDVEDYRRQLEAGAAPDPD